MKRSTEISPRHIFLLTTDFKPMAGGIAEYLHNLYGHVARFSPLTVWTPAPEAGKMENPPYQRRLLRPLPQRRLHSRFGDGILPLRKVNTLKYFQALKAQARETATALREAAGNEALPIIGLWGTESHFWCRALRAAGMKYLLHAHGAEISGPLYGALTRWRSEDIREARGILAISRGTAELVQKRFGAGLPVEVVPPGLGPLPEPGLRAARGKSLQRELALPQGPTLLTVGRLVRRKGVDLVLRSIAGLLREFSSLRYWIAGEGPESGPLRELARTLGIARSVRFLGAVDEPTKWALYDLCDVFVMANRTLEGRDWEGFGIVFLEAALAGKPAVGGKNGGVADAVVDGVTGILANPDDPGELENALGRLLQNPALGKKMGRAGAERARREFQYSKIAEAFGRRQGWI